MTMGPAPLLEHVGEFSLASAYRDWARHYNACVTCQHDSWYSPLLGEPFFCEEGRQLFGRWVRMNFVGGGRGRQAW